MKMRLTYQNISKADAVAQAKLHREQDRLIRGQYYVNGTPDWKGCSIGCDVKTSDEPHRKWAELFGTPEEIPQLIDFLYERLPVPDFLDWHVLVREAIPEGVDLSRVGPLHASHCLTRCLGYIGEGNEPWRMQCREVLRSSRDILATGRYLTEEEAAQVARAAEAAWGVGAAWAAEAARGARAAWAAGVAEAAEAAEAAGGAWAAEAAWAAWAAYAAGAAGGAETAEIKAQADDLLELLRQTA